MAPPACEAHTWKPALGCQGPTANEGMPVQGGPAAQAKCATGRVNCPLPMENLPQLRTGLANNHMRPRAKPSAHRESK